MTDPDRLRRYLDLHPRRGGVVMLASALGIALVNLVVLALAEHWMPAGFPFAGAIAGAAILYVVSGRGWSQMNESFGWTLGQCACGAVGVAVGFGANLLATGAWL